MTYVNIPANLRDMWMSITDRVSKLENAPDSAQDAADTASTAAANAFALASSAVQTSVNTIVNATNQLTAINGNGITVYSGASSTSGARVVLNSAGLAGFNSSGVATFAIDATTGNVSLTGTVTSTAGQIGGWSIAAGSLSSTTMTLDSSNNAIRMSAGGSYVGNVLAFNTGGTGRGVIIHYGSYPDSSGSSYPYVAVTSLGISMFVGSSTAVTITNSGGLNVAGQATVQGNLAVQTMSSGAYSTVTWNSSNSRYYYTSSSRKFKENIVSITGDLLSKVLQLNLVKFNYKPEFTDDNRTIAGLIAEDVYEIDEFKSAVNLDKNGEPESISYDRLAMFFIPAIKQLDDRLKLLETK
jgi:Chaperone of endosialidase